MTRPMLALTTAAIAALTLASATAANIARKAPPKADRIAQGACWWEPPVYYRNCPDFVYYPYDNFHRRPGCGNAYYAPRWSGLSLNPWRN
jgi:hypothetical protein